jgi:hypothetical protein
LAGRGAGSDNGGEAVSGFTHHVDDKKRVPKPDKEKRKKDDEDDEDDDDCFTDCLGILLEGMLADICGDDEDEEDGADLVQDIYADEFVAFAGLIEPIDPEARDLAIWNVPGGEDMNAEVVSRLPRGMRVEVLERRSIAGVSWFRVSGLEPPVTSGWVPAQEVVEEITPQAAEEPVMTYGETGVTSSGPPKWQVLGDLSWALLVEEDLQDEYEHGGFRPGIRLRACPAGSFQVGLGFGRVHCSGDPQFNFVITDPGGGVDSTKDIPSDSEIDLIVIELQAGQYIPLDGGVGYFAWSIGPTLFRVKEEAHIDFHDFVDDNVIRSGERRDELVRWKVGADARVGLKHVGDRRIPLGVTLGVSVIPWEGENDKSLTLDWTDSKVFVVFYFGVTLGYSFY